jgi:diguanylate cyclase (GGDEF)-like protein
LIILPKSSKENAKKINKRIDEKIEEVNAKNDCQFHISISSGIADYSEDHFEKVDDFINLADNRMYKAKEAYYKKK